MDSSLGKALIMAGGVLVAMLVISFVVFSFRKMSGWSEEQKQQLSVEQVQKFNKEYEAYDKDLMYGVDVISCLNKARSNNEKVENGTYGRDFLVTVSFHLKSPLQESVTIYNYSTALSKEVMVSNFSSSSVKFTDIFGSSVSGLKSNYGGIDYSGYLKSDSALLSSMNVTNDFTLKYPGTFSGTNGSDRIVVDLLSISKELKLDKTNPNYATDSTWSRAEWKTPLHDMKTRRFTCDDLQYDANTGRVNYIRFREL